jgi:AraC-like DNA-binding protein
MNCLTTGEFFGDTSKIMRFDGITITDTEYTHDWVDWHYHENTYFTFLLEGRLIEGNKKEKLLCTPGTLLYHSCQEPHYNIKSSEKARGFHVEIENSWPGSIGAEGGYPEGSFNINNGYLTALFRRIHNELYISGNEIIIEDLLILVYNGLMQTSGIIGSKPPWMSKLIEILNDCCAEKLNYKKIAAILGIHPVHLSRDFKKHTGISLGEYTRRLKIQNALNLVSAKEYTLTQIALMSGFADQSHFIKWFRHFTGINPLLYRKKFSAEC